MNLYSKTFYILNFSKKKNCMAKYTQNQEFTGGSKGFVWGSDLFTSTAILKMDKSVKWAFTLAYSILGKPSY